MRGAGIMMTSQGLQFGLRMISVVILARILAPSDFGLIAMVAAITAFVKIFKDLGLSMATMQKKEISHGQVSTLFWINLGIGVLMMFVIAALSPIVAWFYDEPRLTLITLALSISFFFSGLAVQHQALLRRLLRFKSLAVVQIGSMALSIAVGVISALNKAGYWSLVWMNVTSAAFMTIGFWLLCEWRPGLPKRGTGVRQMISFGKDITGYNLVYYFSRQLDKILIGQLYGANALGLYNKAHQIMMLPVSNLRVPIVTVSLPVLSKLQNNPKKFGNYYNKILLIMSFLSMPVMLFLFICSKPIILLILGEKWLGMNNIFKFFALIGFIQPIATTAGLVLLSLGHSDRYFKWGLLSSIFFTTSFVIGLPFGALGVASSYAIANYLILLPSLWYCFRSSPITVRDFFRSIWRAAVASIIMAVAIWFIQYKFEGLQYLLLILLLIGISIYLLVWSTLPGGLKLLRELLGHFITLFDRGRSSHPVK
ncbi:lipopolysaccharide biosynthesis protein [Thermodesulfobacteriota bacterium]